MPGGAALPRLWAARISRRVRDAVLILADPPRKDECVGRECRRSLAGDAEAERERDQPTSISHGRR